MHRRGWWGSFVVAFLVFLATTPQPLHAIGVQHRDPLFGAIPSLLWAQDGPLHRCHQVAAGLLQPHHQALTNLARKIISPSLMARLVGVPTTTTTTATTNLTKSDEADIKWARWTLNTTAANLMCIKSARLFVRYQEDIAANMTTAGIASDLALFDHGFLTIALLPYIISLCVLFGAVGFVLNKAVSLWGERDHYRKLYCPESKQKSKPDKNNAAATTATTGPAETESNQQLNKADPNDLDAIIARGLFCANDNAHKKRKNPAWVAFKQKEDLWDSNVIGEVQQRSRGSNEGAPQ